MKKTQLNKIGKIGKINIEANKTLKWIYIDREITRCELCGTGNFLSFHHRHKREWYRSKPEMLAQYNQTLLVCMECHDELEENLDKKQIIEYTYGILNLEKYARTKV